MSTRKQFKIKQKQKVKRHKRLKRLKEKGAAVADFFFSGRYIGPKAEK